VFRQIHAELTDLFRNQPPETPAGRRMARYQDPLAVRVGQLTSELEAIERRLLDADVPGQWRRMSQDARRFYSAWLVLRRDQGRYLLGLDLGTGRGPTARQVYQADTFQEFCAESFMHVATGALADHLHTLAANPLLPPEILDAWQRASAILEKYRMLLFEP
jgi:hypothetical protein